MLIKKPIPRSPHRLARFLPLALKRYLPNSGSLSDRARRAGVWIVVGMIGQRVIQFGSNLLLTRLLFPEAFGLMALATVFMVGLAMFSDVGLKQAIIRDPRGDDPVFLNTAWTIQIIRGALLALAACAIAWPASRYYDQPILFPLLCVIAMTAAISGFACIKVTTAERALAWRQLTFVNFGGQLAGASVLIALALWTRSVWALAVGNVIGAMITLALGHVVLHGHRHKLMINREAAIDLLKFGRWIFFSTAVTFIGNEGLKALQGGLVSISVFGVLAISYSLAAVPADLYSRLTGGIGLPALAEIYRNNPAKLRRSWRKLRLPLVTVSFCGFTAMILVAEPLIAALYDPRYHDAGIYLELLLIAGIFGMIPQGYLSALLVIGHGRDYFVGIVCTAVFRVGGVYVGYDFGGVTGMITGMAVANLLMVLPIWAIAWRHKLLDLGLDLATISSAIALFWYVGA